MSAATGAARAQKISMRMVRIIFAKPLSLAAPVAVSGALCASPFSQAVRRARCSGVTGSRSFTS